MDLTDLLFFLPSPDADVNILLSKASETIPAPSEEDNAQINEFTPYCKSVDLCKVQFGK